MTTKKSIFFSFLIINNSAATERITFVENSLKVDKIENFFGSDFEFCVISLLVMLKY